MTLGLPTQPGFAVVPIVSADEMYRQEQERKSAAEQQQSLPVISNLASFVRRCWTEAVEAKREVEAELRDNLRQRQGRYSDTKLAQIKQQGGSEVFMMLTSVKCRAAAAWLRDAMLGTGTDKPWGISATPDPALAGDSEDAIAQQVQQRIMQFMEMSGASLSFDEVRDAAETLRVELENKRQEDARREMRRTETRMEDVLVEGGFLEAFSAFLDDLVTFKAAFIKGPVVVKKVVSQWVQDQASGEWVAEPIEKLVTEFTRVSPFDIYPAPYAATIDEGYIIQRQRLTRQALYEMIGVPGYSEDSIRGALEDYGRGGLRDWLAVDPNTGESQTITQTNSSEANTLIDTLEFWGSVPGRLLVEWGVPRRSVPDMDKEYQANVWLIGNWVVKAVLNHDPFNQKPYFKAAYEEVPGAFWGNGIPNLISDVQDVCNASARALVNNMGLASGPQVWVNTDRMPPGESITSLFPWKIWQTTSDPMGSTAPPLGFFQPSALTAELMAVFEKFSTMADEYSGIPRYMSGNENVGGAGRTASGLSMMINNASKLLKQVVSNVDRLLIDLLTRVHRHLLINMRDPDIRGDVMIVPKGAAAIMAREALQVRRNEFLQATANPLDSQIIGVRGRAMLLRENAKLLGLNPDDVVPDPEMAVLQQRVAMLMQQGPAAQQAAPEMNPHLDTQSGRPAAATMDRVA